MRLMCRKRLLRLSSSLQPDGLFIRTLQAPDHVVPDELTGGYRISSQAFRPSGADKTVSGDLEQLLTADGLTATVLYPAVVRSVGAASLPVSAVRDVGCEVEHLPVVANWYHGGITGIGDDRRNKTKRTLARASSEIVPIDANEARRFDEEKRAAAHRRQIEDTL